jgi:hypothetical protein
MIKGDRPVNRIATSETSRPVLVVGPIDPATNRVCPVCFNVLESATSLAILGTLVINFITMLRGVNLPELLRSLQMCSFHIYQHLRRNIDYEFLLISRAV